MLLSGAFFRERPWQHEFGLEHRAGLLDQTIKRGGHPWDCPGDRMALDVTDPMARVELIPAAVEVLGDQPELDDQHAREVEGGRLTARPRGRGRPPHLVSRARAATVPSRLCP